MAKLIRKDITLSKSDWEKLKIIAASENAGKREKPSISAEIRIAIEKHIRDWERKQEVEKARN